MICCCKTVKEDEIDPMNPLMFDEIEGFTLGFMSLWTPDFSVLSSTSSIIKFIIILVENLV